MIKFIPMKKQYLIVIHGPSGSGKSTVTDIIKEKLRPSVVLGSDRLRFHITDYKGKDKKKYFDLTREIMMGMVKDYLDKGFTVIVEDQFKKEHISKLKNIANKKKVPFSSYELLISRENISKRFEDRQNKTTWQIPDKKFIDWQYKEYMNNKYKDSVIFNTDVVSPEKIAKEILKNCEK